MNADPEKLSVVKSFQQHTAVKTRFYWHYRLVKDTSPGEIIPYSLQVLVKLWSNPLSVRSSPPNISIE